MVLWKSRWSSVRFVNAPTVNGMPSTRCSASAWDETSITTCVQPASSICRSRPCRAKLSGVVRSVGTTVSPMRFSIVPMRPTFAPSVCSSTCLTRQVTVVLPFVPVTPIMHRRSAGWPNQLQPSCASAARASRTRTHGVCSGMSCSHSTQAAPRAAAAGMKRWPSVAYPEMAANSSPARPSGNHSSRPSAPAPGRRSVRAPRCPAKARVISLHSTFFNPVRSYP